MSVPTQPGDNISIGVRPYTQPGDSIDDVLVSVQPGDKIDA